MMEQEITNLVREATDLLNVAPPKLIENDAPTFQNDASEMYIIGLVGGKEVGKSSIVNALIGKNISTMSSHGEGTDKAIAYAHESRVAALLELLETQAQGKFRIVSHREGSLARQVLMDLPDIDSLYESHLALTRQMLRHMLFPVWVQSIEKYADLRPQELLKRVAEGNDPQNFLFCLNKVDQLVARHGVEAAEEIRADYSERIARLLDLKKPPRVWLLSATNPTAYDFEAFRAAIAAGRSATSVNTSRALAERQQSLSLLRWLDAQQIGLRAEQSRRAYADAEELALSRIVSPLLDVAIPNLLNDAGQRITMTEPAIREQLRRWPIVSAIDAAALPLIALLQKNISASADRTANPDVYLRGAMPTASAVQTTFAQLHQTDPHISAVYGSRKIWEQPIAEAAVNDLRARWTQTLDAQRAAATTKSRSVLHAIGWPFRFAATIGVILWFVILQPIFAAALQPNGWAMTRETLRAAVEALSVAHFLECASFLFLYFAALWLLLRWRTFRRANYRLDRWAAARDDASLSGQTLQWMRELLEPLEQRQQRVGRLDSQIELLRTKITDAKSAAITAG